MSEEYQHDCWLLGDIAFLEEVPRKNFMREKLLKEIAHRRKTKEFVYVAMAAMKISDPARVTTEDLLLAMLVMPDEVFAEAVKAVLLPES